MLLRAPFQKRLLRRVEVATAALACAGGAALLIGSGAGVATAATSNGTTTANAVVSSSITLSGLTNAFTLTGAPGVTATTTTPVTMNVKTNQLTGYTVTVQANAAIMTGATTGNTDTIPVSALTVRETGSTPYLPLSSTVPVLVHTSATKSATNGDTINNDYAMTVPFVNADTYSVALTYVAATK
jgi:hypothetical protein